MVITDDIKYIGVNDYKIQLFEGLYTVKNGMAYNSYVILDEKTAIMDTVEESFTEQWFSKMEVALQGRTPNYLIVQHMESDHSANIKNFMEKYPQAVVVASQKAFYMMKNFFDTDFAQRRIVAADGDVLSLGRHKLHFVAAPMVHWPEVMVTYDSADKVLFSADGFGKFGTTDVEEEWIGEARRYYFGIVGKYGVQVQKMLKKVGSWDIAIICPLHGNVLSGNTEYYLHLYNVWSGYQPEEEGVLIAYASVYGNTEKGVFCLAEKLKEKGCKVCVKNLCGCDLSEAVAQAFRYSKLVIAAPTYNAGIFPPVREFITWLTERNFSNRKVGLIENGSWMPVAAEKMRENLEVCKNVIFAEPFVKIMSVLKEESSLQTEQLAQVLCEEQKKAGEKCVRSRRKQV